MNPDEVKDIIIRYWNKNYHEYPRILQVRKHEDYFIIDTVRGSLTITQTEVNMMRIEL